MGDEACPICGPISGLIPKRRSSHNKSDSYEYECRRCGTFEMTRRAAVNFRRAGSTERENLSGWLQLQHQLREIVHLTEENIDALSNQQRPSVYERAVNVLRLTETKQARLGAYWEFDDDPASMAVGFTSDRAELLFLVEVLVKNDLLTLSQNGQRIRITPQGYSKLDELRNPSEGKTGFVAMSFEEGLDAAYANGIKPAIERSGYQPVRLKNTHHANKIDDEIIVQINQARFLVVDLTLHRQNVYFEAGYALGKAKTIIWTCRESDADQIHFDIRQYNCLEWVEGELDEFSTQLGFRIQSVVGPEQ